MKKAYMLKVIGSNYCKIVFIISLILSYFLIPKTVFTGIYYVLAAVFMLVFAISITCIIRNLKERLMLARTYEGSTLSIIAVVLGLSALQVCGVGAPICGATVGLGIVSVIFPGFFVDFLTDYSVYMILFSIILQLVALYFMNCFKKSNELLTSHCPKYGITFKYIMG
ncbi:MAG: hypothetical protein J7L23_05135 [Candidatus Diapherotrites archaeon]|nr:hypothetical protein [Candidatus Diapherotrites archaeon]